MNGRAHSKLQVPVGPFRTWLQELVEAEGGTRQVGYQIGIPARQVHAYLHERQFVSVDVVDRAVCVFGDPSLLAGLVGEWDARVIP